MHRRQLARFLKTLLVVFSIAPSAWAHILVTEPTPRVPGATDLKRWPCSSNNGPVTVWGEGGELGFAPGEQITLKWTETIIHAGYFRVVVGLNGDESLVMPSEEDFQSFTTYYSSNQTGTVPAPVENPMGAVEGDMVVYYDYYAPHAARTCGGANEGGGCTYEVTMTLPQECERCTLQLVQTMAEGSRRYGADAHYYHCIDITIEGGMARPDPGEGGTDGETDGGTGGSGALPNELPPDDGVPAGGTAPMMPMEPGTGAMPNVVDPPGETPPTQPSAGGEPPVQVEPPPATGTPPPVSAPEAPPLGPAPMQTMTAGTGAPVNPTSTTTTTAATDTSTGGDDGGCSVAHPGHSSNGPGNVGWLLALVGLAHGFRRRVVAVARRSGAIGVTRPRGAAQRPGRASGGAPARAFFREP